MGGLYLAVYARVGDQIDFANTQLGDQIEIRPRITWNMSKHLMARLNSSLVTLDSKEGPNIFKAKVHDLRMTWQFNIRSFVRITVQHQDVERNQDQYIDEIDAHTRDVGREILYSYKINPQTLFYLGYSDGGENDELDHLKRDKRTIFTKFSYAWQM